jgi:hypothetical protein
MRATPLNEGAVMRQLRFRLRTVMITIAFVALILTVVIQSIMLRRSAMSEQLHRIIAEYERARAEAQLVQARAALERANQQIEEKNQK